VLNLVISFRLGYRRRRALPLRLLRTTSRPLGQALLEGVHEIDDLRPVHLRRDRGDFLALHLEVHEIEHALPVVILVLVRLELVARELLDQPLRQAHLAFLERGRFALADLAEIPHLVGEVHRVQHQPALRWAHEDEALFPAHDILGEGDALHLRHRVGQEPVRLLAALVGAQVVRLLEVDRVHGGERHELGDVDDLGGLALERLDLLVREADVLVLGELVPLHDLAPVHHLVVHRAEHLLAEAVAALGVELVEADPARGGGGVELDGYGNEPERDGSGAQ